MKKLGRFSKLTISSNWKRLLLVTVVGVAGSGAWLLTSAATPTAFIEPEGGTISGSASSVADTTASGGRFVQFNGTNPAPSGEAMPVGDLPGWQQVFTDDFTKDVPLGSFPAAVTDKWTAYPYPWRDSKGMQNSDPALGGWYYPEKVISFKNGKMDMWLHTETIDGAKKRLVSAPVPRIHGPGTEGGQGQLYGRYAMRFRADKLPGYITAWLLWPDSGVWPRDGEVDYPDGPLEGDIAGFVKYQGSTDPANQYWALSRKPFSTWHTAVMEWSPGRFALYMDGALISAASGGDASGGTSEWTGNLIPNTPMHWVMQTETNLGTSVPTETLQGHVEVDWVAIWRKL